MANLSGSLVTHAKATRTARVSHASTHTVKGTARSMRVFHSTEKQHKTAGRRFLMMLADTTKARQTDEGQLWPKRG